MPATTKTKVTQSTYYKRGYRAGQHAQRTAAKIKWNRLHTQIDNLTKENQKLESRIEDLEANPE